MITSPEIQLFTEIKNANYQFAKMTYNYFIRRNETNKRGLAEIYINVRINGQRKKIPLSIKTDPKLWDSKKKRMKTCEQTRDIQLLLDDIDAKITAAKISFRMSNTSFTMEKFQNVLSCASYETFRVFFERVIVFQELAHRTKVKHRGIIDKVQKFMPDMMFADFDKMWFDRFRNYLKTTEENASSTINSNISVVKRYLYLAQEYGIKINCDLDKIEVGPTNGRIVWLDRTEINKLKEYYFSTFIPEHLKLTLGYFLVTCFTSLRISDLYERKREEFSEIELNFFTVKSQRKHLQVIGINETTKQIVAHNPNLFLKKKSETNLNDQIKKIAKTCGIKKKLTMHVGRHTFATNYIISGGNVKYLQELLGHKKLETTMVYVHITNREAAMTTNILD